MPPSDRANWRSGNLRSTGDHNRSVAACMALRGVRVIMMSMGAPGARASTVDDEPMWRQMTVPSSSQAAKKGSQWSPKMWGQPSLAGSSENVTAWQPLAAMRWISLAISPGSQMGGMERGMKRPGWLPHHSSTCQSL